MSTSNKMAKAFGTFLKAMLSAVVSLVVWLIDKNTSEETTTN